MPAYAIALNIHLSFGAVALATFWLNAALPKGTRLHRQIGTVFFLAIGGVIVSALPLMAKAFVTGQTVTGVFLSYLVMLTGTAIWTAWRAIRDRAAVATFVRRTYRPLVWPNLAAAALVLGLGLAEHAPLLAGFSLLGFLAVWRMVRFMTNPPADHSWWLRRHYVGIVGSGVATHIAFLNFGLRDVIPFDHSHIALYLAWFGPSVMAVGVIQWLDRRYGHKGNPVALIGASSGEFHS